MRTAQSDLAVKLLSECDSKGQRDNTTHPHRSTLDPLVCGVGGGRKGGVNFEEAGSPWKLISETESRHKVSRSYRPEGVICREDVPIENVFSLLFLFLVKLFVCSFYRTLAEKCNLYQLFQVCTTDRYTLI